jgi:hypothetical protein
MLSDIVWAASAGFIGVIVAEIARKFIPEQGRVDAEEELLLTDAEIAKLVTWRRFVRFGALIFGLALPLLIYGWPEYFSFGVIAIFVFHAFAMWVLAEIFLSMSPKQQTLTRLLRKE